MKFTNLHKGIKAIKKTSKAFVKPSNYRKTMNTVGKIGGYASKAALGAAIYSTPGLGQAVVASQALKYGLKYGQKYGDKYFEGKKGAGARIYRSGRDVLNTGVEGVTGNYTGAAKNALKLVGDTGFLKKDTQRKYDKTMNNYIAPTLTALQPVNDMYQISKIK